MRPTCKWPPRFFPLLPLSYSAKRKQDAISLVLVKPIIHTVIRSNLIWFYKLRGQNFQYCGLEIRFIKLNGKMRDIMWTYSIQEDMILFLGPLIQARWRCGLYEVSWAYGSMQRDTWCWWGHSLIVVFTFPSKFGQKPRTLKADFEVIFKSFSRN